MKGLKQVKRIYSVFSIGLVILGTAFLLKPNMEQQVFCRACGVILLLFGIVRIFGYFSRDLLQLAFQYDFAMGIISGLIGLSMLIWHVNFMQTSTLVLALFMLADALLRVQTSLDAKKIGLEKWWIILIMALLTALTGTMLFLRFYRVAETMDILIGINLIIYGILNFFVVQSTVSLIRRKKVGSITNFVGFRIPLVAPTTHIE